MPVVIAAPGMNGCSASTGSWATVIPPAVLISLMPLAPSALAPERMIAMIASPKAPGGAFEKHVDGRPRVVYFLVHRQAD